MNQKIRQMICRVVLFAFWVGQVNTPTIARAQVMPLLSVGANGRSPLQDSQPPVLLGLKIHPENPLLFDFIVDRGQAKLSDEQFKVETIKLVKYFLTALTIPDKESWVNLSPTEKDRIIPDALGKTEMGKTMLEQDYILKQLAASLTNPETELGKKYWANVGNGRDRSLQKVWIVPAKAKVIESNGIVLVDEKRLKVLMAEEYDRILDVGRQTLGKISTASDQPPTFSVFRNLILPRINQEINESKDFAPVRQIYNSVILAAWYKQALKESLLGRIYTDKAKTAGVETDDKQIKQRIYEKYLEAFKKGAYNFIKEEEDLATGGTIPRKYFSGGAEMNASSVLEREISSSEIESQLSVSAPTTEIVTVLTDEKRASSIVEGAAPDSSSVLRRHFTASLTDKDPLIKDELTFLFHLFGNIDLEFVPQGPSAQGDEISMVSTGDGRLRAIRVSENFTPENLIDILAAARQLNPKQQMDRQEVAVNVILYLNAWQKALAVALDRQDLTAQMRNELDDAQRYLTELVDKINRSFDLPEMIEGEKLPADNEARIADNLNRVLVRTIGLEPAQQQKRIEKISEFFAAQFVTHLTDQLDTILMQSTFDLFLQLVENWDIPKVRNAVLVELIGQQGMEEMNHWLELEMKKFEILKRDPQQSLRDIHILFAKEIMNIIRTQFPQYGSGKFHIGKAADSNAANCAAYATMFYLIAKEIGLDVRYTDVKHGGPFEDSIGHAANIVHVPAVDGRAGFVVVDATWDYVSDFIAEDQVDVQLKNDTFRRMSIPPEISEHRLVFEYANLLEGVRSSIYSWAGASNQYLVNRELQIRIAEKMLRKSPSDSYALFILGDYFYTGDPRSRKNRNIEKAIDFFQRSIRINNDGPALERLATVYFENRRMEEFIDFVTELLASNENVETYINVANALSKYRYQYRESSIDVLKKGLNKFPKNSKILGLLFKRYESLWYDKHLADDYSTAAQYAEESLRINPHNYDILRKYWIFLNERDSERFVAFCNELMKLYPAAAEPVLILMQHAHPDIYIDRDQDAQQIAIAKEYLGRPEATNRTPVLEALFGFYTSGTFREETADFLRYLEGLLKEFPNSAAIRIYIAKTLIWLKRPAEAVPYLEWVLNIFPDHLLCLRTLIDAQFKMEDWGNVVVTAEKIFNHKNDDEEILELQGHAYEKSQRLPEAIIVYERLYALARIGGYSTPTEKFRLKLIELRSAVQSAASTADKKVEPNVGSSAVAPGGIDFDTSKLNLQIKRDGHGVPLPLPQQNIENINIDGLFPVIINIQPVNARTLPLFLGQAKTPSSSGILAASNPG